MQLSRDKSAHDKDTIVELSAHRLMLGDLVMGRRIVGLLLGRDDETVVLVFDDSTVIRAHADDKIPVDKAWR